MKAWNGWFAILIAYLYQRLLPAIINFLSLSDESFSPKESGCTVLASLPIFEIVFAASIVLTTSVVLHYLALQHQYRIVTMVLCLALGKILRFFHVKETSLNTSEMFQVKKIVSWIFTGSKGWHNANLILIWYAKVSLSQKYRCWNPMNALPLYRHRFCLQFKYRYLKSWKICYQCSII